MRTRASRILPPKRPSFLVEPELRLVIMILGENGFAPDYLAYVRDPADHYITRATLDADRLISLRCGLANVPIANHHFIKLRAVISHERSG